MEMGLVLSCETILFVTFPFIYSEIVFVSFVTKMFMLSEVY